jgi:hypothetical protein
MTRLFSKIMDDRQLSIENESHQHRFGNMVEELLL